MSPPSAAAAARWQDAVTAAALVLVDAPGCGGMAVRARAGPVRELFLADLAELAGDSRRLLKIPPAISDDRLIGGLDLTRTLAEGRPAVEPGVLQRADGGLVVVPGAERLPIGTAARIAAAMDRGAVSLERDGLHTSTKARFATILIDEGTDEDDAAPGSLMDRVAFHIDLEGIPIAAVSQLSFTAEEIAEASRRIDTVTTDITAVEALIEAADAFGIASQRAPFLALRAARASAALDRRENVSADDLELAARLVLGPRATMAPVEQSADQPPPPAPEPPPSDGQSEPAPDRPEEEQRGEETRSDIPDTALLDMLIAAAAARLPAHLLGVDYGAMRARAQGAGKTGRTVRGLSRGVKLQSRPGKPGGGRGSM